MNSKFMVAKSVAIIFQTIVQTGTISKKMTMGTKVVLQVFFNAIATETGTLQFHVLSWTDCKKEKKTL